MTARKVDPHPALFTSQSLWASVAQRRYLLPLRRDLLMLYPGYAFPERHPHPRHALQQVATDIHDCLLRLAAQETPRTRFLASRLADDLRRRAPIPAPVAVWAVRVERTRQLRLRGTPDSQEAIEVASSDGSTLAAPAGIHLEMSAWLHLEHARRAIRSAHIELLGASAAVDTAGAVRP